MWLFIFHITYLVLCPIRLSYTVYNLISCLFFYQREINIKQNTLQFNSFYPVIDHSWSWEVASELLRIISKILARKNLIDILIFLIVKIDILDYKILNTFTFFGSI